VYGIISISVHLISEIENGRYGHALIRSDTIHPVSIPIRYRSDNRPFSNLRLC